MQEEDETVEVEDKSQNVNDTLGNVLDLAPAEVPAGLHGLIRGHGYQRWLIPTLGGSVCNSPFKINATKCNVVNGYIYDYIIILINAMMDHHPS